jgi:hypothetical protein
MEASSVRIYHLSQRTRAVILMATTLSIALLINLFIQYSHFQTEVAVSSLPSYLLRNLLSANFPHFTPLYLLSTLLTALGSLAFVVAFTAPLERNASASMITAKIPNEQEGLTPGQIRFWIWSMITIGVVLLALFIFQVDFFSMMALEDGFIETLSALGYLIAMVILIALAVALLKYSGPYRKLSIFVALGGAFVLFVMGGEEISWGQRIFNIATPDAFTGNHQGEMNLHNFAANTLETIFYFLAAMWLVIIPFINDRTGFFNKFHPVKLFIPARFLIFVGVIAVAYNYDKWDVQLIQFCFFVGVFIVLYFRQADSRTETSSRMIMTILALIIASQIAFVSLGSNLGREWDITEYREMFVPFGYMVYSLDVFQRVRRSNRAAAIIAR